MNPATIIQFGLLFLKLANWITGQVDRKQWESSGYSKAMADQLAATAANVGLAKQVYQEADSLTRAEKEKGLQE
jgi:hypothetical protein